MPDLLDADALFEEYAFENALPIPDVIDTAKRSNVTIQVREFDQFLGLYDDAGNPLSTTVWGYMAGGLGGYPGPTIIAYRDQPITVRWQNQLPVDGHLLPIDMTIHLAEPVRRPLEAGFVPIVTHLHGGHNLSAFDGTPEQWFTQSRSGPGGTGPREVGADFVSSTMEYLNDQQSATLWYHDHALGITRLNVYAGLAGFYVLQDDERSQLIENGVLPSGVYDIGMAIQDRAFTADGQLYYPAFKNDPLPGTTETVGAVVPQSFYDAFGEDAASIVPEFFGDTILVNGMAWPNLDVAAGSYEFRLLNGSDSRFYILTASDAYVAIYLVGTDSGLLANAITISDGDGLQEPGEFILLAPGDRVELVFDFSKLSAGETVTLLNSGPLFEPFKGVTADGLLLGDAEAATADDPVGNIMQFTVTNSITPFHAQLFYNGEAVPLAVSFLKLAADLNDDGVADAATNVRNLGLFETSESFGRVTPMLGKAEPGTVTAHDEDVDADFGPLSYDAPTTELPVLGSTEQWNIFNFTADTHPIHLHLVHYQVVEKHEIFFQDEDENGVPDDTTGDGLISYGLGSSPDYSIADIWIGEEIPLRPEETGWQDTVHVDPGTMASIVATFDLSGLYVWHCHILSHEDNEMMRPFFVDEASSTSSVVQDLDPFHKLLGVGARDDGGFATGASVRYEQARVASAANNNVALTGAIAAAGLVAAEQLSASTVRGEQDVAPAFTAASSDAPALALAAVGEVTEFHLAGKVALQEAASDAGRHESAGLYDVDQARMQVQFDSDASHALAAEPLLQATETSAHQQVVAMASLTATAVAVPSAEQLAFAKDAQPDGSAQHNQLIGQLIVDSIQDAMHGGLSIDSLLDSLPSGSDLQAGFGPPVDQLAELAALSGSAVLDPFAGNALLVMEQMMTHVDAV